MWGRYAVSNDPAALAGEFDAVDRTEGLVGPDYNVTPAKTVPIIVQRGGERSVRPVRWGLVPTWSKDANSGPPMINARAESITVKPAYAESAARRCCLLPATGWYAWQARHRRRPPVVFPRRAGRGLDTPRGPARSELHSAEEGRAALLLGHGAGGGVCAQDLVAATRAATQAGVHVALVEQPYRVAGRKAPAPAKQLDAAWLAVAEDLGERWFSELPLLFGGRSSGARVACRTADKGEASAVLCLA